MLNVLFLGAFPPQFLINRSNGRIDSRYRASEALIKGLRNHEDVYLKVITSPDIVSYPKGPFYIKKEYNANEDLTLVSSLNIQFLKQIWTILSMISEARKYIKQCNGKVAVIIPYLVFRHVLTLRLLHFFYPQKVVQISVVPDIFFPQKTLHRYVNRRTEKMASKFDFFVFYTQKMAEYLSIPKERFVVIEGFRDIPNREPQSVNDVFKVVYAGLLQVNYGITRLIEAMEFIREPDVQLHLYGDGNAKVFIEQAAKCDSRIIFHGSVSNEESIEAIYSASALINPRNSNDGEYVEYSFPSKDIQYMATGIPTLLCKLPSMPEEYYGYFIDMGDASPEQIALSIMRVKKMKCEQRKAFGERSRIFISDRMDYNRQASKIISHIESLVS